MPHLLLLLAVLPLRAAAKPEGTFLSPPPPPPPPPPPVAGGEAADTGPARCYGDRWGCIPNGGPFKSVYRPVNLYPMHPVALKVHFLLMTRRSGDQFEKLRANDSNTFMQSSFDASKPVIFIVHGYLEHGSQKWIKDMTQELLSKDNFNVISVDWVFGAAPPYAQAVANARMTGIVLADFIQYLQSDHNANLDDVHIIGHSLGAHVAGYAGEKIPGLGRITGLDPAEPYFQWTDPKVRLDPTDAKFVDVIHTDGASLLRGGLGMIQDCGHVDFYPNGGKRQPGCDNGVLGSIEKEGIIYGIRRYIGCNHLRAYELFRASINTDCPFYAYQCDSYTNFTEGLCSEGCGQDTSQCAPLGYRAVEWKPFVRDEPVKMFLETGNSEPFCNMHYLVQAKFSETEEAKKHGEERGRFFIQIFGTRGPSHVFEARKTYIPFIPGKEFRFLLSSADLGRLLRVQIHWLSASHIFNPLTWRIFDAPSIYVDTISITILENKDVSTFCGMGDPIYTEKIRVLYPADEGGVCPEPKERPRPPTENENREFVTPTYDGRLSFNMPYYQGGLERPNLFK